MHLSFKYKFIVAFLIIETIFISLIVFFNFASINKLSHALIEEKMQTESALFTEMVKESYMILDLGTLDNQVKRFCNLKNIAAVKVFDSRQRVISYASKETKLNIDRFHESSENIQINGRTFRLVTLRIVSDHEMLGNVKILFELTESLRAIDENRKFTFFIITIEILLSALFAYIIGHTLTNALNRLTLSAARMAQDDPASIAEILKSGDEILILSHTFHLMQQRVEERDKNLVDAIQKYQDSTTHLQTLLDAMSEGVYGVNTNGECTFVNHSFLRILGYENANEVLGKNIHKLIHHSHADGTHYPSEKCVMLDAFHGVPTHADNEVFWHKEGQAVAVEYWSNPIIVENELVGVIATFVDISKRKITENELYKLSQAIEQNPNAVIITDLLGNIEYVNTAFIKMTGYELTELIGYNPRLLHSGRTPAATYHDLWNHLRQGENWKGEFVNRHKDGSEYIQSVHISPLYQSDGQISHYVSMQEDITERKYNEERIHYLANFDLLTGLPNRAQMADRFKYILNVTKRNSGSFAVMFLDLDHFKNINDTLGHSYGDGLLNELAKRLQAMLREEDMVSRMGGDEFIIILPNVDMNGAEQVAQKLLNAIIQPFFIERHELTVSASIGIALYPVDGIDSETLSKNADTAMYRAKQEGRNHYCFFTEDMQVYSRRHLQLTNALRHALENNELHLVYQPQISLMDESIIGAEVLLRWQNPELGSISPAEFIPIAEDSGLIVSIGEWVLSTAVKQAKVWIDQGFSQLIIAVNLSAVQFRQPGLASMVTRILEETHLPAEHLELELTEGAAMHDPQSAIVIMNDLHTRGIRMSIDDFGTGYSSLSYLKKFKVYKLKIDQSFVRDITTDSEDKAIVNAIINMANSLGLQTIAEGVETKEQLECLTKQGCNEVQGYYYSKPLDAEAFQLFLETK